MKLNKKPTETVLDIMATGKVTKFTFDSRPTARKFQQSMTMAINRMMTTKMYDSYWSYLEDLRVMKDGKVVYIGPTDQMPELWGKVEVEILD